MEVLLHQLLDILVALILSYRVYLQVDFLLVVFLLVLLATGVPSEFSVIVHEVVAFPLLVLNARPLYSAQRNS